MSNSRHWGAAGFEATPRSVGGWEATQADGWLLCVVVLCAGCELTAESYAMALPDCEIPVSRRRAQQPKCTE